MAATVTSIKTQELVRNDDGHRDYNVTLEVLAATTDGPRDVMVASGMPLTGTSFSLWGSSDTWARRHPNIKVRPVVQGELCRYWLADIVFSTRPMKRCQDNDIEDPLFEPDRISGSFIKYTKEATVDKNGNMLKYSNHEKIRGSLVEVDANRPQVVIEQNVATLDLDVFAPMVDTLNDSTLWGLSARKIKLSDITWERLLWGTCNYYYKRRLTFDVNYNGFDRDDIIDYGNKVLRGRWVEAPEGKYTWTLGVNASDTAPDKNNPNDFIQFTDVLTRPIPTKLDGNGNPLGYNRVGTASVADVYITASIYSESNFLTLGIPTSL